MKAKQQILFLLTLFIFILKVNNMKGGRLALNMIKNQAMKPNANKQVLNQVNMMRQKVAKPLAENALKRQRPHIPIVNQHYVNFQHNNGNRMNNMNNIAQENIGQQDKWGQLLQQSKETGQSIYELMAEMRAERRAKTELEVQQQIKKHNKQEQEFLKSEVKKNDLVNVSEQNISQVLTQNQSFQKMLLKNFKMDQNQMNFFKNLNSSGQNIIIKDLIRGITSKDILGKQKVTNDMIQVLKIEKGNVNINTKDLLQTMEKFNEISSKQALNFLKNKQGDSHQLMNIAKKLQSLTIKSTQQQNLEQNIPSGSKLEQKNSQELIEHIDQKTNQQIEQIKQIHQEIENVENNQKTVEIIQEQPNEIINVPQEQKNIIEQKQESKSMQLINEEKGQIVNVKPEQTEIQKVEKENTNLQVINDQESKIIQNKPEKTEMQVINPENTEIIEIKNDQKHLDVIKPTEKSLEVINRGMNDLSIIKTEQNSLTDIKQQPNQILVNKPEQTNLIEIKQQPSGIQVIKPENKDMIIQQPIDIIVQENQQLGKVIEENPQVKELLEKQIENIKIEQQKTELENIKKIQPILEDSKSNIQISPDQQPSQNLIQNTPLNINPQLNLIPNKNFMKLPNSLFYHQFNQPFPPISGIIVNMYNRIQISEIERNIIQQEADKINKNNTIKNINEIYGTDNAFKPNWYKDLMRENPIFSYYNNYKNMIPKQEQIQPKEQPLKTPNDYIKFMQSKYVNFNPSVLGFNGIPQRKLPYPLYQIKMYDYEIPEELRDELDEVKINLTQIYQEEIKKMMAIDLAYYNIILNIEEMCIEDDRLSLKQCSQASKLLIDFYMPLKKHLRRDFVYLKNQILNQLTSINLDYLVENLEENNILENWCQLYSRMQGRLEYLLLRYTAVQII